MRRWISLILGLLLLTGCAPVSAENGGKFSTTESATVENAAAAVKTQRLTVVLNGCIAYEVDTRYLGNGDRIEGAFYLVTNSGEKEIPYTFTAETGISSQILEQLKTAEDFARVAKEDKNLAMRLFEYQDFVSAPFMQDIRVRAVYDGLKGHGDRMNLVEEFMTALDMKKPVEIEIRDGNRTYARCENTVEDSIVIRRRGWGYVHISIDTDGDFIDLPVSTLTDEDFENGACTLKYRILPERLHRGKNLGAIHLLTAHGSTAIQIEAIGDSTIDITGREHEISKAGICRYMKLREQYEASGCTDSAVLNKIQKELDAIRGAGADSIVLTLLQAETYLDGAWSSTEEIDRVTQVGMIPEIIKVYGEKAPVSQFVGPEVVDGVPTEGVTATYTNQRSTGYSASGTAKGARGRRLTYGTVAVNPSVIPYGTLLYITSDDGQFVYGYAYAADTGTTLMTGHAFVDLYYETYEESVESAVIPVTVYVIDDAVAAQYQDQNDAILETLLSEDPS